jgi:hypothetical protein
LIPRQHCLVSVPEVTIACPAGRRSSNTLYLSGDKWELSG